MGRLAPRLFRRAAACAAARIHRPSRRHRLSITNLEDRVVPSAPPAPNGFTSTTTPFTNNTPAAISATGTPVVTSTITVSGVGATLHDLDLTTLLTHTNNGQLDITLTSPAGTVVTITSDNGGTNDDVFNGTVWDDDADPDNEAPFATGTLATSNMVTDTVYANLAVESTLTPEEAVGAFIGEDPNGVWTLTVSDDATADGGSLNEWKLDVTTLNGPLAGLPAQTFTNTTPAAISASGTPLVTSTIDVTGAPTYLKKLTLFTDITHTFIGDLDITLTSPTGTKVTISTDNGGTSENVFAGTLWDDDADPGNPAPFAADLFAASRLVTDNPLPDLVVQPLFVPEEALAAFIGEDPNGTWTLKVGDDAGADGGFLNRWTLSLRGAAPFGTPIATGSATNVTTPQAGATAYQFTVTYADDTQINVSSLDGNDVRVTGPGGFSQLASLVGFTPAGNGSPRTATYQITPPGGAWNTADNGLYTVTVQPNQVLDVGGTAVITDTVATFDVGVLIVTNTNDAGPASLRELVARANIMPGPDLVLFDPTVFNTARTISLATPLPVVNDSLTLTGPGANLLTVRRDANAATANFRILDLTAPTVAVSGMRLTGGNPTGSGGAINVGGTATLLNLDGVVLEGNTATSSGGAIFVGTGNFLNIKNSTLSGNTATSVGGGIYFTNGGGLVMDNVTVSGNLAGTNGGGLTWFGIASATPPTGFTANTVVVKNSTFGGNSAGVGTTGVGGAISIPSNTTTTFLVENTRIANNRAAASGGGLNLAGSGTLSVVNSAFDGNAAGTFGGGIGVSGGTGTVTVVGSSIAGNTAATSGAGIGVNVAAALTVQNSTLAGNTAGGAGGGIGVTAGGGTITIENVTIAGNAAGAAGGGGIARPTTTVGTVNVRNTVVALNTAPTGPDIVTGATGTTLNIDASAVGDTTGLTFTGTGNVAAGTDLKLGILANYGGGSRTITPLDTSPLIDAGNNSLVPAALTTDQRGTGFVRQTGTVDIGAVEVQAPFLPVATASPVAVTVGGGTSYTFTVTFADPAGASPGIETSTVINNNAAVRVTGPNGLDVAATYVSIDNETDGTPRTATYSFTPPGGSWDGLDNGVYTVRVAASQVKDLNDNFVTAGPIAWFSVQTPYVVTSIDDSGAGTFREAVTGAALNPVADTILFDPTVFGPPRTISLRSALPILPAASGALTVTGPGAGLLTIERNAAAVPSFRMIDSLTSSLSLSGLRLYAGRAPGNGGAINHAGASGSLLTLNGVMLDGNAGTNGGAVFVGSGNFLDVRNSTISGNAAGGTGGAITFNSGGGLVMDNVTILGNAAATTGAGIMWNGTAAASVPAGFTASTPTVTNSTFDFNLAGTGGGAIQLATTFTGTFLVLNSNLTGNAALGATANGGGIHFASGAGTLSVVNSTLAGNTAGGSGGGIAVTTATAASVTNVVNSTLVGNRANATAASTGGGGIGRTGTATGTINIANSVVAGNLAAAAVNGPDVLVPGTSTVNVNFSAVGDANGYTPSGTSGNNLAAGTDLKLGPLAIYGGATRALAPRDDSPLINAGDGSLVPGIATTDQRGGAFIRQVGTVDIGAIESQAPFLPVAVPSTANVTTVATSYTFTVAFSDPTGPNGGVKTAGIINNNAAVRVTGPNGFDVPATHVSIDNTENGTPRTATYTFTPPGGSWDGLDNGIYSVRMMPNQVQDLDDNFAAGGLIGTFRVIAPYFVTTAADGGTGSLRDVLSRAGADPANDTVLFDPGVFGTSQTISLLSALPTIGAAGGGLTVTGPGATLLTVRRDSAAATNFRLFDSTSTALTLTGMRLTGGNPTGAGGAILQGGSAARLTLDGVVITGNTPTTDGGGISIGSGTNHLVVRNTTISGNSAGGEGGGIYLATGGLLDIRNASITGNTAGSDGGAIYFFTGGNLVMENTTVSGNTSAGTVGGGGLYWFGTVSSAATLPPEFTPGVAIVRNSTFTNNTASAAAGGGILITALGGTVSVQNTTLTGNTAATSGGGVSLSATIAGSVVNFLNATITGNTASGASPAGGGGIARLATVAGDVNISNTVVSNNTAASGSGPDILTGAAGTNLNINFSAVGDTTGLTFTGANNVNPGTNLLLGSLGDNGGTTFTRAPQPGSPLINAGSEALLPAGLATDQRGAPFARKFGSEVDIGAFEVQPPSVTINQATAQADPTNGSIQFDVVFNAPVTGFTAADVDLSTGTLNTGLTPNVTGSGRNYTVTVTGMNGTGTVIARIPQDAAVDGSQTGNSASTSTDNTVTFDNVRPTVTINKSAAQADPTNVGPIVFDVHFSEPVSGFTAADIDLSGTLGGPLTPVVSGSGADYTVTVSGMNGTGTVVATIAAGGATDAAGNTNTASTSTDNSVIFDNVAPTVTIDQAAGQNDPTNGSVAFEVHFSEPVTGFLPGDIDLTGSTAGGTLTPVVSGSGADYTVTVTGMTSNGTVVAAIPAGAALDQATNSSGASTSTDNTVTFDNVAPTVTIDQAAGQADPANGPVLFTVHFSESVTGFDGSDIDFAGTTVGGTPAASVSGSGQDYTVTVTGQTGVGDIVVSIPAARVTDPAGNDNTASTSTDDTVTFDNVVPTATIAQAAGQPDPVAVGPIVFDVHFSEPVFNFTSVDLSGSTVGGTVNAQISGSGQDYTVTVSGMAGVGTVVVAVPDGAAQDLAGNDNTAATGDGSVLFDTIGDLQFSAATYTRSEIGGTVTITVTRTNGSANAVTVDYATSNGTAEVGLDYTAATGTLSWANGDTESKTFVITILDDAFVEGTQTVNLTLSNPTNGAALGAQATATLNITDFEEGVFNFSTPTYSAAEDGSTLATITVTRASGSDGAVSVDFATTAGTATAGSDYTTTTGTLTWADGESTSKSFTVPVTDDTAVEADETVNLALSNPTGNAVIGSQGTATLTILDVEEGVLEFSDPMFRTAEDGATFATITVTRSAGTDGTVTVDYATTNGTAIGTAVGANPADYTPTTGTLTFAEGVTVQTFSVPILDELTLNEGRETVLLSLSNPTGNGRLGLTTTATLAIDPSDGKVIQGLPPTGQKPFAAFTDEDGDLATVKLAGRVGSLKVFLTDTDGDGLGPIELIEVSGTNPLPGKLPTATLTMTSAKPRGGTGDGLVTLGGVTGTALKSFTATKTDLVGDGFNMTGFVGSIVIRDVLTEADILLNGAAPTSKAVVKITARQVGDGSDVTVAAPISALKAWNYGDGTITAPSIGTMTLTGGTLIQQPGNVKIPVAGDLEGDIVLSGAIILPLKAALNSLTVAGSMTDTASITAPSVGTVTVKKDMAGDITVSGAGVLAGKPAMKTLKVIGAVTGSTIDVAGSITAITAGTFVNSSLYAGYNSTLGTFPVAATVGSFKVTGKTNGFANSFLYATNFNSVVLASVVIENGPTPFGVYADTLVKALSIGSPAFKFVLGGPTGPAGGDFEVRILP